jgi:hypothetical protein
MRAGSLPFVSVPERTGSLGIAVHVTQTGIAGKGQDSLRNAEPSRVIFDIDKNLSEQKCD